MKKYIFLILTLINFLNADSMIFGKCVSKYFVVDGSTIADRRLHIYFTNNNGKPTIYNFSDTMLNSLNSTLNNYYYDSSKISCNVKSDNLHFGMTQTQYNFLLAIYGIFLSSLISFGLIKAF